MKSEFGAPKELTSILQRKNRKINMRQKDLNFLDRNEFNYSPSKEVVEALKNFDINKLCFYTRIYDEGKKSILSVFLSELYDIDETQVLLNKYPNLIISRTLSKFYGLPGLRMGFGFMSKELEKFSKYSNKYLGYNRISEDIAIAALKSDAHYRNIAKLMNEDRARYEKEIGVLPGFKVYESVANFILIKYPIALKEALQKAFAEQSYKVKFMNEPDINTHLRITLGRPEQNRIVIDTIKEIASK